MLNVRALIDAYYHYAKFLFLEAFRAMYFSRLLKVRHGTCSLERVRKKVSPFFF
jgi:hypothetical protein